MQFLLIFEVLALLFDHDCRAIEPIDYVNYYEEGYHINKLLADVKHYKAFSPDLDVDNGFEIYHSKNGTESTLEK